MSNNRASGPTDWLRRGGKMGGLIAARDWSKTPVGSIDDWPQSLQTMLSVSLASDFPINIIWGPQRTQIYNESYQFIYGNQHPHCLGQDFKDFWRSIWNAIEGPFERAFAGETTHLENQRIFLDRNGYLEETFFTFSFSPIRNQMGGVDGLFNLVIEMTQHILAERRMKVLHDLSRHTANARTVSAACGLSAEVFMAHELDLPFTLFYQFDLQRNQAHLISSTGLEHESTACPAVIDLEASPSPWDIADLTQLSSVQTQQLDDLEQRFGSFDCGPYPESPKAAIVFPIAFPGLAHPWGVFVAGVSSRRSLDEPYQRFYTLLGQSVTTVIANAHRHEEEHKRAAALTEVEEAFDLLSKVTQRAEDTENRSRILLVNDKVKVRNAMQRVLSQRWQVETAPNGRIALEIVQQQHPDLVLTEVMMSEMDGLQLLNALRSDPMTSSIPVILLSARAEEAAIGAGLEAGADNYLLSPFSIRELQARVATQLQLSQLRQEQAVSHFKDELLTSAIHKLQSTLTLILGWTRLFQRRSLNPTKMSQGLEVIERNALVIAKLVKNLLDTSSILAETLRLKSQVVDLEALVQEVVLRFRPKAEAKQIQLTETLSADKACDVFADGDRIQQIIESLLENAIKYTPEGGQVHLHLERLNANVRIIVRDTGVGIPSDLLPHIFDRLLQAKGPIRQVQKRFGDGLGVELAIVRHLVELHQGSITVASDGEGQGATFTVQLPLDFSCTLTTDVLQ